MSKSRADHQHSQENHEEEDVFPPAGEEDCFKNDITTVYDNISPEDQMILREGVAALKGLIELSQNNDGWDLKTTNGIKCYTKYVDGQKVVKMVGTVGTSAQHLWTLLYPGENTPEWSTQTGLNKSLYQVDRTTDVVYTISNAVGPISARDFVSSRKIEFRDGQYYLSCKSIVTDLKPEQSGKVRGETRPCGYVVIPINSQSCQFIWVYNSAIKGWLPQIIVDQAVVTALIGAYQQLQIYAQERRKK